MDIYGNIKTMRYSKYASNFGEVKDLKLVDPSGRGLWQVSSNGRQLTNVYF